MSRFGTDLIRRYYEGHTRTFVAFGQGGSLGTMHRAVAGPGVTNRTEAFRYVENRILSIAQGLSTSGGSQHVVDLGCGVGGSLCYLAERLPITATGITLSPTQATIARRRIASAGLSGRVTILAGDYSDVPTHVAPADLAFAVESFVHASDPAIFFAQCRRLVRPGGALILCDDFRRRTDSTQALAAIERFCRGWHINTLLDRNDLHAVAAAAGFDHESTTDLSAYVEIGRLRDRIVEILAGPIERLPWRWSRLGPWLGGNALQTCLRHGWIGYDFVVFWSPPDH